MAKTNLTAKYFRARLFERASMQFKSVFIWEFGQFGALHDFYKTVKNCEVKRDDARIEFYLCHVGDSSETLLESVNVNATAQELLNYEHPRRVVRSGQIVIPGN